jgi:ATP dependent DNA ligase domain
MPGSVGKSFHSIGSGSEFVVTGAASAYLTPAMKINPLPAEFVVPAQPVKAPRPPVGTDWVHEIKHDGFRIIVRRDGPTVRLYSRNDWTARQTAIAAAAELIKAKSFTIDGEAVVLGPDGLLRFEELSRRGVWIKVRNPASIAVQRDEREVEWVFPQRTMASLTQLSPGCNAPYRVVACLAGKVGSTAPKRPPNQPAIAPRRRVMKPNSAAPDTVLAAVSAACVACCFAASTAC